MHISIPEQGKWLAQVVKGYFAYHAVPTNLSALNAFRYYVARIWLRVLRRRSQKDKFAWERIEKLADDWLPQPRILHPWPQQRFAVKYSRWEPYAGNPPVRICAGGGWQRGAISSRSSAARQAGRFSAGAQSGGIRLAKLSVNPLSFPTAYRHVSQNLKRMPMVAPT
jgi:hypothetical protein